MNNNINIKISINENNSIDNKDKNNIGMNKENNMQNINIKNLYSKNIDLFNKINNKNINRLSNKISKTDAITNNVRTKIILDTVSQRINSDDIIYIIDNSDIDISKNNNTNKNIPKEELNNGINIKNKNLHKIKSKVAIDKIKDLYSTSNAIINKNNIKDNKNFKKNNININYNFGLSKPNSPIKNKVNTESANILNNTNLSNTDKVIFQYNNHNFNTTSSMPSKINVYNSVNNIKLTQQGNNNIFNVNINFNGNFYNNNFYLNNTSTMNNSYVNNININNLTPNKKKSTSLSKDTKLNILSIIVTSNNNPSATLVEHCITETIENSSYDYNKRIKKLKNKNLNLNNVFKYINSTHHNNSNNNRYNIDMNYFKEELRKRGGVVIEDYDEYNQKDSYSKKVDTSLDKNNISKILEKYYNFENKKIALKEIYETKYGLDDKNKNKCHLPKLFKPQNNGKYLVKQNSRLNYFKKK